MDFTFAMHPINGKNLHVHVQIFGSLERIFINIDIYSGELFCSLELSASETYSIISPG